MKSVMEEGQIKIVFQFFHESAIILWRAILLGQRIIITGINEDQIKVWVKSLLLFLPNDNRYELYPLLELKEIPKLQDKLHFIAGMKIPLISAGTKEKLGSPYRSWP